MPSKPACLTSANPFSNAHSFGIMLSPMAFFIGRLIPRRGRIILQIGLASDTLVRRAYIGERRHQTRGSGMRNLPINRRPLTTLARALLGVGVLLFAWVVPTHAQDEEVRHGFWWGMGLGYGLASFSCDSCSHAPFSGWTLFGNLGLTPSPHVRARRRGRLLGKWIAERKNAHDRHLDRAPVVLPPRPRRPVRPGRRGALALRLGARDRRPARVRFPATRVRRGHGMGIHPRRGVGGSAGRGSCRRHRARDLRARERGGAVRRWNRSHGLEAERGPRARCLRQLPRPADPPTP